MAYNVPLGHIHENNRLMIAEITTMGFTWIHFLMFPAVSGQNSCSSGHGADPGHNEAAFLLFDSTNFPEIHDQENP